VATHNDMREAAKTIRAAGESGRGIGPHFLKDPSNAMRDSAVLRHFAEQLVREPV